MRKLLFIMIFISGFLYSQSNIIEFDYAKFMYDSSKTYLEVYYYIDQSQLKTIFSKETHNIDGILNFKIIRGNEIVKEHNLNFSNNFKSIDEQKTSSPIFGVTPFVLEAGNYKIVITLFDKNDNKNLFSLDDEIVINRWDNNKIQISDIELSNNIVPESNEQNSQFYKNSYEIYPNPTMYFTSNFPALFYYYELYNLNTSKDGLYLLTQVYDNLKNIVYQIKQNLNKNYPSQVKVGKIDLSNFNSGSYTLTVSVVDTLAKIIYNTNKKFFYFNPNKIQNNVTNTKSIDFVKSEYNLYTEEECDDMFNKMKYIITSAQQNNYSRLTTLEGKRKFLYEFWTQYEANNDYGLSKDIYMERVQIANKRYSAAKKEGWKTDRGRVYILYGEPSEYERFPSDLETRPYEIWRYNEMEGGVYFIFADIKGFSDYELLTSTKRGELNDEYWQQKIQVIR